MTSETKGKSILTRLSSHLRHQFIRNPYLQGALVILGITIIFSFRYLINSGVPVDYEGDLLTNAASLITWLRGPAYFFSYWSSTYSEIQTLGALGSLTLGNFLLNLQFLFLVITGNIWQSFKLLQVAEIFCAGFFMFLCVYVLTKRKFEGILAGVLYMLAPFNLVRVQGHIQIAWSFAFLPLAYLAIYKAIVNGKLKYAVLAALPIWLALTTYSEDIYLNGIPLLVFSLLILFLYAPPKKRYFQSIAKKILSLIVMFGMAFWLSLAYFVSTVSYFWGPIYSTSYIGLEKSAAYTYSQTPIASLFLFEGEGLRMNVPLTSANFNVLVLGLSVVLLSSILIITKKNDLNLSLFVIGVLCMIFSMGVFAPSWLSLFNQASNFLPGFVAIITPGRFIMSAYFSFIFLASIAVGVIAEKFKRWFFKVA